MRTAPKSFSPRYQYAWTEASKVAANADIGSKADAWSIAWKSAWEIFPILQTLLKIQSAKVTLQLKKG